MRQRASIAMALSCDPSVLIADEPTTALDVMVQAQILELLDALCRDFGLALLLVTHDLPVVAQLCDRAAVMYAGEIVEWGAVDALYHEPRHPYTRLLFAATPDLHGSGDARLDPGLAAAARPRARRLPVPAPLRQRLRSLHRPSVRRSRRSASDRAAACHLNDVPARGCVSERERERAVAGGRGPGRPLPGPARAHRHDVRASRRSSCAPSRASASASTAASCVALVGESGCGKTTTAQTVLRLLEPAGGRIAFDGQDITTLSTKTLRPLRRRMQIIYQDPYESLDPRLRVRATIEEPLLIHGAGGSKKARAELIRDALNRVELNPPELFLDRYPHELSGGQRQRVAIAAAIVLDPELLVADEPVSMLDVSVRAGVLSLLDRLREGGLGILMITHDLSTAARFADRIAVMYLGPDRRGGPGRDRRQQPAAPVHEGAALGRPAAGPARAARRRRS